MATTKPDRHGSARKIVAATSRTPHEIASISASVRAPGTMVSGMRSWLPSLPVKAVTRGPGPSLLDALPSTRTDIERSSVSSLISSSRLLPSRIWMAGGWPVSDDGGVGVPGDHLLGLLARLLAHQVDDRAPLLALRRLHDVEHGDPPARALGAPAGIAQRIAHLRAFVDDDQEDAFARPGWAVRSWSAPLLRPLRRLEAPHDGAAEPAGRTAP